MEARMYIYIYIYIYTYVCVCRVAYGLFLFAKGFAVVQQTPAMQVARQASPLEVSCSMECRCVLLVDSILLLSTLRQTLSP